MTNAPSPQPPEIAAEAEKKPLKPGKGYGIAALCCALFPLLFFPFGIILERCGVINFLGNPNDPLMPVCTWSCLIGTLVFGMIGRKTQGRLYANIALSILLLFGLLGLFSGLMFVIFIGILEYPT